MLWEWLGSLCFGTGILSSTSWPSGFIAVSLCYISIGLIKPTHPLYSIHSTSPMKQLPHQSSLTTLPFLLFLILVPICHNYTHNKIQTYFHNFDTNSDGILHRSEYQQKLQEEDKDIDVQEKMEYYAELTQLIYQKYDVDGDMGLTMQQWVLFAQDIYDQYGEQDGKREGDGEGEEM